MLISRLLQNYPSLLVSFSLLLTIACSTPSITYSQEWKQQKIATMYSEYARKFPQVRGITVSNFKRLQQQDKIVLVDVRSPQERAVSIIPGALSLEEFEQNLDRYKDDLIVVYCTIGYRSGKYAQKLQQQGLNILNLEGSLLAWSHIGGKLVNSSGNTQKIHVFSDKWQLIAEDYQPVW